MTEEQIAAVLDDTGRLARIEAKLTRIEEKLSAFETAAAGFLSGPAIGKMFAAMRGGREKD